MLKGYWATPQMLGSLEDRVKSSKQCQDNIRQHHKCWGALRIGSKASNNARRILGSTINVGESIGSVERMSNNPPNVKRRQKEIKENREGH
jgi:hypothetical protein